MLFHSFHFPLHFDSWFLPSFPYQHVHFYYSNLHSHLLALGTHLIPQIQFEIIKMQIDYHITNVARSKPMEVNEKVEAGLEYNAQIKAIDWNCDGSLLVFGGKDKAITIWNPKHTTVLLFGRFEW